MRSISAGPTLSFGAWIRQRGPPNADEHDLCAGERLPRDVAQGIDPPGLSRIVPMLIADALVTD